MSPVPNEIALELESDELRRRLYLSHNGGSMSALLYPGKSRIPVAWAAADYVDLYAHGQQRCRLVLKDTGACCLWLGHAAFDVTPEEATRIANMFEPVGLKVETLTPLPTPPAERLEVTA